MDTQQQFAQLEKKFNLKPTDFYFLDLIPLIGMIWADGENQQSELKILYNFVIQHISFLDKATGAQVVSVEDANDFLDRFAHTQPSPELLEELRLLVINSDHTSFHENKTTILEYCMDIAAACTTQYPFELRGRIINEEKAFMLKLFQELNVSPEQLLAN